MPKPLPIEGTLPLARQRLLQVTSRLLAATWLPLLIFSAVSVWERPVVRDVVLATTAMVAVAVLILWRPSRQYAWAQASLFLLLLAVGIPAAGGVSGITPGGMATAGMLVAWGTLFFGTRGLWSMLAVVAIVLLYNAWQFLYGQAPLPRVPDLRSSGYWWRNIPVLLSTFLLGGLIVRTAITAYDEAFAAERASAAAAAAEEAARLFAEGEAEVLKQREISSALAAGLAHDLSNAIHVTSLHAEELLDTLHSPEDRALVETMLATGQRATLLVRQLLALGRDTPSSGDAFSGGELVTRLESMLHGILPASVQSTFHSAEELMLRGDVTGFEQVVINLVLNARDAMPSGGTLDVLLTRADAQFARLDVRDSGTGIAPEVRTRIFRPFFTTKKAGDGSGLGLSMVSRIVTAVGGRIDVASDVGSGSCFSVFWPLATVAEMRAG